MKNGRHSAESIAKRYRTKLKYLMIIKRTNEDLEETDTSFSNEILTDVEFVPRAGDLTFITLTETAEGKRIRIARWTTLFRSVIFAIKQFTFGIRLEAIL